MPPWKPHAGRRARSSSTTARSPPPTSPRSPPGPPPALPKATPPTCPPPVAFADDWTLGTPDLVLEPAAEFSIPAAGGDIYRCFVIPTNLPKDMYISAIEYRPGNRQVVHHMLGYVDTSGDGRKRDEADPGPGYSCFSGPGVEIHGDLGGWAPGNEPSRLPDGIGRLLPKGADVIVQMHYHPERPARKPTARASALHFATQTRAANSALERRRAVLESEDEAAEPGFAAGRSEHRSAGRLGRPVDLRGACGHAAHAPARPRYRAERQLPGRPHAQDLIKIDDWDFGWQNTYFFENAARSAQGNGRDGRRPLRQFRPAIPGTRTSRPGSSPGARRRPTRCASALSPSPRRVRT